MKNDEPVTYPTIDHTNVLYFSKAILIDAKILLNILKINSFNHCIRQFEIFLTPSFEWNSTWRLKKQPITRICYLFVDSSLSNANETNLESRPAFSFYYYSHIKSIMVDLTDIEMKEVEPANASNPTSTTNASKDEKKDANTLTLDGLLEGFSTRNGNSCV